MHLHWIIQHSSVHFLFILTVYQWFGFINLDCFSFILRFECALFRLSILLTSSINYLSKNRVFHSVCCLIVNSWRFYL